MSATVAPPFQIQPWTNATTGTDETDDRLAWPVDTMAHFSYELGSIVDRRSSSMSFNRNIRLCGFD